MKMENRRINRKKTLWEKEKLLVTSIFCSSHIVFNQKTSTVDMEKPGLVLERVNQTTYFEMPRIEIVADNNFTCGKNKVKFIDKTKNIGGGGGE